MLNQNGHNPSTKAAEASQFKIDHSASQKLKEKGKSIAINRLFLHILKFPIRHGWKKLEIAAKSEDSERTTQRKKLYLHAKLAENKQTQ